MIIDVYNNNPPNFMDYAVRMERTGEILRDRIFYADDEAGFFDRYVSPETINEAGDALVSERIWACIKIIPWPVKS